MRARVDGCVAVGGVRELSCSKMYARCIFVKMYGIITWELGFRHVVRKNQ